MFRAGCGIRLYRFLIVAFLSTLLVIWGQKLWHPVSSENLLTVLHTFYAFFIRTQFWKKMVCSPPPPSLGPVLPTLRSHLYCCSYAMKPDGRRANQIIVEKSWPNRKETLIIPIKLEPNVIHSQLGVISVRNMITRLKKLCIFKPIWRIRYFVDQQTINEDPRLAVNIVMADKTTHAS